MRLGAHLAELGCTLGDELLRPTIIYVKLALELFERFAIKGLANITGGGIPENLPRVLPKGLRATIARGSWPVPPIFDLIQRRGKIDRAEMDRAFNNGIGMVAVAAPDQADAIVSFLKRRRQPAYIIGSLERGARGVTYR